ncbi:hypothetical protein [Kistimonas asteriae]|uniref:hypothetical protein n=1 Tax=Kistimonas asteriae TaxID=517724 RepID=UPI001BACF29B|nr:hypothetical protein [Kistimonas asteriae]
MLDSFNFRVFLGSIFIFFISLESYELYRFYPLALIFLVSLAYVFNENIYVSIFKKTCAAVVFILIIGILGQYEFLTYKHNISYTLFEYLTSNILKVALCFVLLIVGKFDREIIAEFIKFAIVYHLFFFCMQYISVYAIGYYIDPLELITGQSQRYFSGFSLPILGAIYRPTGFFLEPSTYATYIIILTASRMILLKKVDSIDKFAVLTCFMTLSLAAIAYSSLTLLTIFYFESKGSYKKFLIPILSIGVLPALYFIYQVRIDSTGGTAIAIREGLRDYVFNQDFLSLLFGNGVLGYPTEIANQLLEGGLWAIGAAALNDNGIWLFLIMKLGVFGLAIYLWLTNTWIRSTRFYIINVIILFTKATIFSFTFIFYVLLIYLFRNPEDDHINP